MPLKIQITRAENINGDHISEARQDRSSNRQLWS